MASALAGSDTEADGTTHRLSGEQIARTASLTMRAADIDDPELLEYKFNEHDAIEHAVLSAPNAGTARSLSAHYDNILDEIEASIDAAFLRAEAAARNQQLLQPSPDPASMRTNAAATANQDLADTVHDEDGAMSTVTPSPDVTPVTAPGDGQPPPMEKNDEDRS
jgi:hypothetical protein